MTILLKQQISNMKEAGFTDIERTINVTQAHIDGGAYNQFVVNYFITYSRNGEDVSHLFKNKSSYEWIINNSQEIFVRDENFQPILKEDYVAEEGVEPTLEDYQVAPAFTYIMEVFEQLQAISYQVLKIYILENDADGRWDLTK